MLLRLMLLFTIVPLIELSLLIWIGDRIGFLPTIGLVIVTGVLGASLARREGLRCWLTAQQRMSRGELPTDSLLDGLLILLAGAVLITPGVLTDLAGFALLIPPVRHVVRRWLAGRLRVRMLGVGPSGSPEDPQRDQIIDVRVVDTPPDRDSDG